MVLVQTRAAASNMGPC